jgi:uncharacterized circularly permuted ATP-grasp superfamily protein/uncharacterized alpha-E superfamily protein
VTTADLDPDLVGGYASRRGRVDEMFGPDGTVRPHWDYVASSIAALGGEELETRRAEVRQLLRIDGATYHVYGDPAGLQRPWELDPVPSLVSSDEWAQVETGCAQRAELLNEVLIDLYGPRDLIRRGLLPLDLIYEHPGFLRACDGIRLPGDRQLVVYAVDLARGSDGAMTVLADRAQAPSGAGYALENRRVMSRVLPSMFRDAGVHRLALFFQTLRHRLRAVAPAGVDEPRVVILTPGSHNETYFEHAFLAAYLGYTLVEGGDLTVRDARVWLRSTTGLEPVDVILRRVDDWWSDPLELRPDSELGVAGLIEATRRGTVSVVNPLGSGVLENPALHAFLPAIAEHLLGHELDLPTVPTWWCGRPDHHAHVVANLERLVIKPVHRGPGVHPVFGGELSRAEVIEWRDRINAEPHRWVGQEPLTGSTVPALVDGRLEPERSVLRAFLVARDDAYVVMPGGLTRISPPGSGGAVTNQTGGSSKDTWVLASEPEKHVSLWLQPPPRVGGHDATGSLASRAAENLFWLGRHGERIEAAVRLLRTILGRLDVRLPGTDLPGSAGRTDGAAEGVRVLLEALTHVTGTQPGFLAAPSPAVERELLDVIFDGRRPGTVATNVRQLLAAAQPVRDLVGSDTFLVINGIEEEWDVVRSSRRGDLLAALTALVDLQQALLALVGVTGESMVRAPDWFFIDTGRRLERALLLLTLVRRTLVRARTDEEEASVAEGVLETAVSLITYRRRYRSHVQVDAVLDLLFADPANPRSLLYNVQRIEENLSHLPGHSLVRDQRLSRLGALALEASTAIRLADTAHLAAVDPTTRTRPALGALIEHIDELLTALGDAITAHYFTHLQGRQLVTVSRMGRFG